jgi:oligo-1,6-glucosidase
MKNFISISTIILLFLQSCQTVTDKKTAPSVIHKNWWKEAVVYQIYPRSFMDSNGDGVGDLKGITSKLDYVKNLGVDVIWLNPIYASPNADNGYDISDYQNIMKEFGTMEDFDALLKGMHERGLKVVMDLVVNHCSDEHKWFQEARKSRTNPYRDYFHWWNAEKGKPAPRFSFFDVQNDAWEYDSTTNAYYLHYFADKQPDLNWENPKVRAEIFKMMRFWFDKGVDGFRMDVIPIISKDTTFPVMPPQYKGDWGKFYANGPHIHDYLQEMNREVLSKYDIMTVAEGMGVSTDDVLNFVDADRKELNMAYHFEGTSYGYLPNKFKTVDPKGYDLVGFKQLYSRWDSVFSQKGWGTIYLGNHDQPRMLTRWGNDTPEFREVSSKMLTTFLMTMRATPYYYNGDELGMNNIKLDRIEDYRDIETLNEYQKIKKEGGDLKVFIESQKNGGARDNGRTPFQWDNSIHAGFTKGTPWLKVNPNYGTINAVAQEKDPNSILHYFRNMVQLRKSEPTLVYGKYTLLDEKNPSIYAYTRELEGKKLLVLLNFKNQNATVQLGGLDLSKAKVLLGNYLTPSVNGRLMPYEAVILELPH